MKYPPEYYAFFSKFRAGEYYECHDDLEAIWLQDRNNRFLQGLLQLAVGMYHLECGNIKGARKLFTSARDYLQKYAPRYWDLNLLPVLSTLEQYLQLLPPVDTIPYEQIKGIPFPAFKLCLDTENE